MFWSLVSRARSLFYFIARLSANLITPTFYESPAFQAVKLKCDDASDFILLLASKFNILQASWDLFSHHKIDRRSTPKLVHLNGFPSGHEPSIADPERVLPELASPLVINTDAGIVSNQRSHLSRRYTVIEVVSAYRDDLPIRELSKLQRAWTFIALRANSLK